MSVRPESSTGSNSTVAAADEGNFSDEAESSLAPVPVPVPVPMPAPVPMPPPLPTSRWCFRGLVDALHAAVNDIRADHGLPPLVPDGRGRSWCARCWCDLEVPDMENSINKEGWIMVCSKECLWPRDYTGKEERWQGWKPWN